MTNEFEKRLMLKFLERNYPVARVKLNLRFKRAIVLDTGVSYVLSEPTHINLLRFNLAEILTKVFSCDEAISRAVLDNFLRLT